MKSAEEWIDELQLKAHPEGGFYREMYRSDELINKSGLPERYSGDRNFATSIYFLLRSEDISAFHRIQSDELWFYHAGSAVEIFILDEDGLKSIILGNEIAKGQVLQVTIPRQKWFAAQSLDQDSYSLVSCVVAPAFDFKDFELAEKRSLMAYFPYFEKIITKFTKN